MLRHILISNLVPPQNIQAQNTQSPKIPKAKILKIEIAILIKSLAASLFETTIPIK